MQATQEPINFEFVSSYRKIAPTAMFCPMTITGNGTGKSSHIDQKPHIIELYGVFSSLIFNFSKNASGLVLPVPWGFDPKLPSPATCMSIEMWTSDAFRLYRTIVPNGSKMPILQSRYNQMVAHRLFQCAKNSYPPSRCCC